MQLPPDVVQLASLRRSLADFLAREEVEPGASAAVVLATHEAAVNAMQHAQAGVVVTCSRDESRITVIVRNAGRWKESDGDEYRGRGLAVMRDLMSQVEVGSRPDGTVVRMHLRL